jgi:flagellar assembly protein FliH
MMKLPGRKVIKAVEVKFLNTPGNHPPQQVWFDTKRATEDAERRIQITGKECYEKGLADGIREGRELEKKDAAQVLQAMSMIIKGMSALKQETIEKLEEEIVQLSLAIAEKVIHVEVTTNREVIRGVLKEAIKNINDREDMKIRLHPQDFQDMVLIKNDFMRSFDGIQNVVFTEDESIQRGGAIIETTCGEVDARLDQQHYEIKMAMTASK